MEGRICSTCYHKPIAHVYANSPQRLFATGGSAPVSPGWLTEWGNLFTHWWPTTSPFFLVFLVFLFFKQHSLYAKLVVCTSLFFSPDCLWGLGIERRGTALIFCERRQTSSPALLDLDRLRRDWWLWLESGISETASSPLTIFYKLLSVVNVVAPAPSVSVTEGWKHTYAPWSQFHNMSCGGGIGLSRECSGGIMWTCFAGSHLSVSVEGQWQGGPSLSVAGVTVLLLLRTRCCFGDELLLGVEGELLRAKCPINLAWPRHTFYKFKLFPNGKR